MIDFKSYMFFDPVEVSVNRGVVPSLAGYKLHSRIMEVSTAQEVGQIIVKFIGVWVGVFGINVKLGRS